MHGPGFISSDMHDEPGPLTNAENSMTRGRLVVRCSSGPPFPNRWGARTRDVPRGLAMLIAQHDRQKKVRGSHVPGCYPAALADEMVVAVEILERLDDAVARAGNEVREGVADAVGGPGSFRRAFSDHVSRHFARAS